MRLKNLSRSASEKSKELHKKPRKVWISNQIKPIKKIYVSLLYGTELALSGKFFLMNNCGRYAAAVFFKFQTRVTEDKTKQTKMNSRFDKATIEV